MSRVPIVDPKSATGEARVLLEAVQAKLGVTPNFIRVLANSPKALGGFLGLLGASDAFAIDEATQQRIALTVAEGNRCNYCVSAHTAIGRHAGLSHEEMLRNRMGRSDDAKANAIVEFAAALNRDTGNVTPDEFAAIRAAGLTDGQIVEVIAVVALNIFTNVLNKATDVEIDFPRVALLDPALRAAA